MRVVHALRRDLEIASLGVRDLQSCPELCEFAALVLSLAGREATVAKAAELKNKRDADAVHPVILSVACGSVKELKVLLEAKADPNGGITQRMKGVTPLHAAAAAGDEDSVRLLLDAKGDPTLRNVEGRTALHLAAGAVQGSPAVLLGLVEAKGELQRIDKHSQGVWHHVARGGNPAMMGCLLDLPGAGGMEKVDRWKRTPLHWACLNGHASVVTMLLDRQASVNHLEQAGESALHLACHLLEGSTAQTKEIVSHLLAAEASVDVEEQNMGRTPLHLAAASPSILWEKPNGLDVSTQLVQLLLEAKAALEKRDKTGSTPLLCAAQVGQFCTVKALLIAQADIAAVDLHGQTALQLANRAAGAKKDRWPGSRSFARQAAVLLGGGLRG